jgi:hypothetical protein
VRAFAYLSSSRVLACDIASRFAQHSHKRRLVPEVIEDFFVQAAPLAALDPKPVRPVPAKPAGNSRKYRLGRIPPILWPIGERLARTGFNLKTQQRIKIPAKTVVKFRAQATPPVSEARRHRPPQRDSRIAAEPPLGFGRPAAIGLSRKRSPA